jgi:hypothetical protein
MFLTFPIGIVYFAGMVAKRLGRLAGDTVPPRRLVSWTQGVVVDVERLRGRRALLRVCVETGHARAKCPRGRPGSRR